MATRSPTAPPRTPSSPIAPTIAESNSARPTAAPDAVTADGKPKRKQVDNRTIYAPAAGAAWADANGKLIAVPEDYDRKKHKPLVRKQYADEGLYLNSTADALERKAKSFRKQAEDFARLGSVKDKKTAKKLLAYQRKMQELRTQLEADGVDVNAVLGSMRQVEGLANSPAPAA